MAIKWEEPKIDWKSTDRFNFSDYNRIKNNISYVYRKATELNKPFDIEDMGEDINDYASFWNVIYFNAWENNIEALNNNVFMKDYGTKQTFYENGAFIQYSELNRLESAILNMKKILDAQEISVNKLPFVLGRFKTIRV